MYYAALWIVNKVVGRVWWNAPECRGKM